MKHSWKNWCRLCAEEQADYILESIEDISPLYRHLQLSLYEIKDLKIRICETCYEFVQKLDPFKHRFEQTNGLFTYLANYSKMQLDNLDINEIRARYLGDMFDDDAPEMLLPHSDLEDKGLVNASSLDEIELIEHIAEDEPSDEAVHTNIEISKDDDMQEGYLNDEEQWGVVGLQIDPSPSENNCSTEMLEIDPESTVEEDKPPHKTRAPPAKRKKLTRPKGTKKTIKQKPKTAPDAVEYEEGPIFEITGGGSVHEVLECKKCFAKFGNKPSLEKHISVHITENENGAYSCDFCDKTFLKPSSAKQHILANHQDFRTFVCEECGKSFATRSALKEHLIVHSDELPFQCAFCPKRFKNLGRLKTHEDTHNETVYVCPHCGLKLNTRRTLNMHLVVHSDMKKFKCQYCGNEYKRGKALKAHLILHTGLRPYACPFCDKTFTNGSNCRSHKKKFHPKELAELEASGGQLPTANIPKLEQLQPKTLDSDSKSSLVLSYQGKELIIMKGKDTHVPDAGCVDIITPIPIDLEVNIDNSFGQYKIEVQE
ncbi:zinc finger protein weckle-like isoform X1 [Anopheles albimanus]|uniref:zinc finger protein weckle-like isoform X1 n=2 Tax=Anopheles albimanus TaxID=7167 RepID=UPI001640D21E|nr:zinc finger protein weckle-like isoform X1 [Anopheles albimanus]